MNLHASLASGKEGMLFTIISVIGTMLLGMFIGRKLLKVNRDTSYLISSGTAICGGSAIAAVGPVIKAKDSDMSVALATIFVLNAIALFIFPVFGNWLGLTQQEFGTWAAIAIHDTSSVVGAGAAYGEEALQVATTIKLTRALWIIPLALATSVIFKNGGKKINIPWFILWFVVAILINTYLLDSVPEVGKAISGLARKGLIVTMFFKAFIEKIPYLKELGITHVQLLPVVNFYFNDEANKKYENSGNVNGNNYNWGYDPHNYFTPEGWYATDAADPYCRIRELRELINECHKAGIGVLLDVVYNHMAGTQFLDDIVPGYYFRTNAKGGFTSNSGCGNDTATERTMMKRLVVDSTSHWVKNYKVDGFRFDLMGLMEASSVVDSYKACKKINASTLFEGEGWRMYNGAPGTVGMDQRYMLQTNEVSVFNDEFRDAMKAGGFNEAGRGFITKKRTDNTKLFRNVTGNPFNYRTDQPGDNLNYLVCHDGLTLHDSIVHNLRLDETKDKKEIVQRIKLGNFIVLTSQGLAFLHAGQESGRTKPNINNSRNESIGNFVRNSYDSSDNINQYVWTIEPEYQELLEYTKGLIEIRKEFNVFRTANSKKIAKNFVDLEIQDDEGLAFGYIAKKSEGTWVVLVNAKMKSIEINTSVSLNNGVIYIDSRSANKNGIENPVGVKISGKTVTLDPLTATVIRIK